MTDDEVDELREYYLAELDKKNAEIERLRGGWEAEGLKRLQAEAENERLRQCILEMRPIEDVRARDEEIERLHSCLYAQENVKPLYDKVKRLEAALQEMANAAPSEFVPIVLEIARRALEERK